MRRPAFELHELRALLKLLSPCIESSRTKDVSERREIIRDYVEMLVDTGHLAARLKEQIRDVSAREKLAKALQNLSQGLFNAKTDEQIIQVVIFM